MLKRRANRRLSPDIEQPGSDITLHSLERVSSETLSRLSALTLPEVEQLKHEIANILPAGNLPGLILSGLANLKERRISRKRAHDDINTLFQGANLLPQGLYSLLIAGPAVVLAAYQGILTLAGKDIESAFPEGTWQFYLQFGLREDTGRHTNETVAYHRERPAPATTVDDITAWIMTAIYALFDTDALNGVMWTEWTTLRLLREAINAVRVGDRLSFLTLLRDWQAARPYHAPAGTSYAELRRQTFESFIQPYFEQLPASTVTGIQQKIKELAASERAAYQAQMSLLAYLEPDRYRDERVPLPIWEAKVALIWRGHTFLFDVCTKDEEGHPLAFTPSGEQWTIAFDAEGRPLDPAGRPLVSRGGWLYTRRDNGQPGEPLAYLSPPDPARIKGQVEALIRGRRPPSSSTVAMRLAEAPRSEQSRLRSLLPESTRQAIEALRRAPVIINWDLQDRSLPLGTLRRRAQRGVGDHPLTIMRTKDSIIFDQSHIFFDGVWGIAMAEVLTNQAVSWCQYVTEIEPLPVSDKPQPLTLVSSTAFEASALAQHYGTLGGEVGAETEAVNMAAIQSARMWLRQRGARLTVNDLLLLGRFFHAAEYQPAPDLLTEIDALPDDLRSKVHESLANSGGINPALLIPMDASFVSPRERIYPTTFRNPLTGLLDVYEEAIEAFRAYRNRDDDHTWRTFDDQRRRLISYLRAFGEILDVIKAITMRGESFNTATLRMLGHLPPSMQHLLDQIPQRVGVLNEIVKGEEVFSNVGRVARGSSLMRFMSAKDDGRAKTLVWGILTDDTDRMHINLRDFRPHVGPLILAGYEDLAQRLAQDYVESYAQTLNRLAGQLSEMAVAEDEMRWE